MKNIIPVDAIYNLENINMKNPLTRESLRDLEERVEQIVMMRYKDIERLLGVHLPETKKILDSYTPEQLVKWCEAEESKQKSKSNKK